MVHRDAASILAQGQFHHATARSWPVSVADSVAHFIERVLGGLSSSGGLSVAGLVVAGLLLVAGVVAAALWTAGVSRDPGVDRSDTGPVGRRPAEWSAEAAEHEAAGEWRDALRCHYRALVAELAAQDRLEELPGRTAREYAREVADRLPRAAADFAEASDLFESAWYGYEPSGPAEAERLRWLSAQVLAAPQPAGSRR